MSVAAEVAALRDDMQARDQSVRDLAACLEAGDVDGAREICRQLGAPAGASQAIAAQN